jgi:hypothetical protein
MALTSFPRCQFCPQDIQRFGSAPLDGTPGQPQGLTDLAVSQIQHQAQNQNALLLLRQTGKGIKPAPFAIVTGVGFHLLTPFRWGMVVVRSLSANRAFSGTGFARKTAFRKEKIKEKFPGRRKRQKLPGRSQNRWAA